MNRILLLLMVGVLGCCAPVHAAPPQEIAPPFGLVWGVSKERLAGLLKGANAKVVEKRVVGSREVWTVEGLVQTHLYRTLFYFRGDSLNEAELQYQDKEWIESDYTNFMNQLRISLEGKFGPGKLIARSKNPQGDVIQTLTGYEWVQPGNAIQLIYFSAESTSQVFRLVSLHYKMM